MFLQPVCRKPWFAVRYIKLRTLCGVHEVCAFLYKFPLSAQNNKKNVEKKMDGDTKAYMKGFVPYAVGAFMVGIIGGFASLLGPAFVSEIGIDYNNTAWTSLATAVSTAALAPVSGKLSDITGRKNMFVAGLGIYTLGNYLSGTADSLWSMLPARFLVGTGTAAITPAVMSYIVTEFPPEKKGKGFSLYMLISSAAVIFGPGVGGMILASSGRKTMMYLCTAICIFLGLLCIFLLRREKSVSVNRNSEIDIFGALCVLVFFGSMLCIPTVIQNEGLVSLPTVIVFIISAAGFFALMYSRKRAEESILQWELIKSRKFVLCVMALFLTQGLMQVNMTDIIVFVNYTQPGNSVISGYAISVMYAGIALGSVITGTLSDRYRPENVLLCAFGITAAGCALMFLFTQATSVFLLATSLGITGFGLGANATVFMKIILSSVPAGNAGAASGTYGLFRDLAAPFGVAVLVPLFTNRISALTASGLSSSSAAVSAMRMLAAVEVVCVLAGAGIVLLIPGMEKEYGRNQ